MNQIERVSKASIDDSNFASTVSNFYRPTAKLTQVLLPPPEQKHQDNTAPSQKTKNHK